MDVFVRYGERFGSDGHSAASFAESKGLYMVGGVFSQAASAPQRAVPPEMHSLNNMRGAAARESLVANWITNVGLGKVAKGIPDGHLELGV